MLKLEAIYDVTIARDGQEAVNLVSRALSSSPPETYNLIFMDIQMPNLDGLQSTRLIRQMGYSAPIVALTAFSEESNVEECLRSGMDGFMSKPIRREKLRGVLRKFGTIQEEDEDDAAGKKKPKKRTSRNTEAKKEQQMVDAKKEELRKERELRESKERLNGVQPRGSEDTTGGEEKMVEQVKHLRDLKRNERSVDESVSPGTVSARPAPAPTSAARPSNGEGSSSISPIPTP